MSLSELIPTLEGLAANVTSLANRVTEQDQDPALKAVHPDFSLKGLGNTLNDLASEVNGQIATARRATTVAVVGEFKVGKSTFINSMLNLQGADALSTEVSPDTACSILIRGRGPDDPQARLVFDNGATEDTDWAHAVNLTSQVWRDTHPEDPSLTKGIKEVEYFCDHPLLAHVNINDLPGTGSRYYEEHTEYTRRKMKEADIILWIVGEEEPSQDGFRDISILQECSQPVIPIINVREDPSSDPPLPRDEHRIDNVHQVLVSEFGSCFDSQAFSPLRISSKAILIENCQPSPDPNILQEAGASDVADLVDRLVSTDKKSGAQVRLQRICGNARSSCNSISEATAMVASECNRWLVKMSKEEASAKQALDEVDDTHMEIRGEIRTLAKALAKDICKTVKESADSFVDDTLVLSNVKDMMKTLRRNGAKHLENDLRQRFNEKYLKLNSSPNWLDGAAESYAEQVKVVVIPKWKRLLHKLPTPSHDGEAPSFERPDLSALSESLFKAVMEVLGKILGVLAIAVLLSFIPGGAILDAVAVVGFIIISVFHDPLKAKREQAKKKAASQIDRQEYEITNRLCKAGLSGNEVIEQEVRRVLGLREDGAVQNVVNLRQLRQEALECEENVRYSAQAFRA